MWKFKELYKNICKAIENKVNPPFNFILKIDKEPESKLPVHKHGVWYPIMDHDRDNEEHQWKWVTIHNNTTQQMGISRSGSSIDRTQFTSKLNPCGTSLNQRVRIEDENSRRSLASSESSITSYTQNYRTDIEVCKKHGDNYVFYDLKKHFECPMCVKERKKIQITDFLTESDMKL